MVCFECYKLLCIVLVSRGLYSDDSINNLMSELSRIKKKKHLFFDYLLSQAVNYCYLTTSVYSITFMKLN